MELYQIWLILALVFAILEIFTSGFAVMCFSFAAILSAVAAYFGLEWIWQLTIFAIASLVAFMTIRPFAAKYLLKDSDTPTNTDALIGRKGQVYQTIDPINMVGSVKVDGDIWKAVSASGEIIEKGEFVEVLKIEGIILTVKKIN